MNSLRIRLGAVILALLTVAAIVFAVLNFQQRSRFIVPDDGVTWVDTTNGVSAWHVVPSSPADRAGIRQGDLLESIRGVAIHRATDATRVLWRLGPWSDVRYGIRRNGGLLQIPLVTEPQANPSSIENYLRVDGAAVSFHRPVHFRAPLERSAGDSFLHFLPGLVRSLQLPLHRGN